MEGKSRVSVLPFIVVLPLVFIVLILLGFTMRANQGELIHIPPDLFYAIMTLHGLGMAGTAAAGGLAALAYLLSRYANVSSKVVNFMFIAYLITVAGLITATLIGRFGPGWYVLYPLPFKPMGIWSNWAIGLAVVSLMVLGVAILLIQLEFFRAMVARYGLKNSLGWQFFTGSGEYAPPIVIITMDAVVLPGILTTLVGAALLMLYFLKWINPALNLDPLLIKNMIFIWGHTLVNITMYMGVAVVYELFPEFSGREWKSNKYVALAWNATFFIVLLAVFHHLYMDFVQPLPLQITGQTFSYLATVPSTVVTVMGFIAQVYKSGIRWSFVPLAFFVGIVGWLVGGYAAVIDSTIVVNTQFHNTLWVPSHFHTYFLLGFYSILWGFLYYASGSVKETLAKFGFYSYILGGAGFLAMFYIAGAFGVPRRYAEYTFIPVESVAHLAQLLPKIAVVFVLYVLIGFILMTFAIFSGSGRSATSKSWA
ncbi:MAG: cbb3-type cytochrome c oxidase subunit I [Hydrogenobacter thermophilus]|uniref:cbb3-type cytochrome c oxidase subunit I n=1 Tax=Hydrogenobacter thermophilus TaxID=940 RepID=UPI001C760677|nr:cbb3-type cytochrome c oxidase subunit I [Hydrogenobacter thermophilus]QWK19213.1 MAG: cbb3-type cytochrome c oxidase subunit I [Hydrogenobacter thermophilus]